jgi:hypothetical protein
MQEAERDSKRVTLTQEDAYYDATVSQISITI